ncbi:MAG: rod shape-determining protein [Bacillota bacterium]
MTEPVKTIIGPRRSPRLFGGRDLGIDLGTATTLVFAKGRGIILREPSVVAIDVHTNQIVAIGQKAWAMIGRTPGRIRAIRPLQNGVITDFETTKLMVSSFIKRCLPISLGKPKIVISVPFGSTQVERRAVFEAARQGGGKEVLLVEEPLAAAIGAGLPVAEAVGSMVVNIGGGTTEVAVIALGGIVKGVSLRSAGDTLTQSIQAYMRRNYRLEIGEPTAEAIKIEEGYAFNPPADKIIPIKGIYLPTGMPKAVHVKSSEITAAMEEPLATILAGIRRVFEQAPPQLASDIIDTGITLTGGGALLKNIDGLIAKQLGLPVQVATEPQECVALGTGQILQQTGNLNRVALYRL